MPGFWRDGFSKLSNRVLSDVVACGERLWDLHHRVSIGSRYHFSLFVFSDLQRSPRGTGGEHVGSRWTGEAYWMGWVLATKTATKCSIPFVFNG